MKPDVPSRNSVSLKLGAARDAWNAILDKLGAEYGPLDAEWKTSKSDFGWMCVLRKGKRTLIYLTPEDGAVRVALVLGERAVGQALASSLSGEIKSLIEQARPYAEGRGIRFPVCSVAELPAIMDLVAMKMAPTSR
jgi:hypothetical protein